MNIKTKRRSCSRFTLVEMLVVIAIICILAGLLLGAIQKGYETSRTGACTNNMRQIGIGVNTYAVNNDGYIPRSYVYWPGYTGYTAAQRKLVRWYMAIWPDFQSTTPDLLLYRCPSGHNATVPVTSSIPTGDSYTTTPPIINYAWNSMRRDRIYYSDKAGTGSDTDPGAYGLTRGDGTMSCNLYMKISSAAPNTLVILDGGVSDASSPGYAVLELFSLYTSANSTFDWTDATMRESFTQTLPGANYCHNGGVNGLSIDGSAETLRRTPFYRFTIRADTEDTTP